MIKSDFNKIQFFTQSAIEATGSNIEDVKTELVLRYDHFRKLLNRRVYLIKNGITTGVHSSKSHSNGLAGDHYLDPADGEIDIVYSFKCALEAGFKEYGVYWNGAAYSFHLGCNKRYKFWSCKINVYGRQYYSLITDPRLVI